MNSTSTYAAQRSRKARFACASARMKKDKSCNEQLQLALPCILLILCAQKKKQANAYENQGDAGGLTSVQTPLSPHGLGAQSSLFWLQVAPSQPVLHWHAGPEAGKRQHHSLRVR